MRLWFEIVNLNVTCRNVFGTAFCEKAVMLPQAGVEPAFSRLEVGRDIHFATKVVYYTTKSLNEEYVIEFKMAILCAWTRARSSTFSMAFS